MNLLKLNLKKINNLYLSQNIFKSDHQIITLREKNISLDDFKTKVNNMVKLLEAEDTILDKIELEECIHDTNEELDANWVK